jgi:hypothetical protein
LDVEDEAAAAMCSRASNKLVDAKFMNFVPQTTDNPLNFLDYRHELHITLLLHEIRITCFSKGSLNAEFANAIRSTAPPALS